MNLTCLGGFLLSQLWVFCMKNRSCQNGSGRPCNYKYLRKKPKRNTKPTEQKAATTKYTKTTKQNTKPTKVWNISKNVKFIVNG